MCHCLKLSSNTTGICLRQHIFSKEKRIWQIFNGLLRSIHDTFTIIGPLMLINTISMWTLMPKMFITVRNNIIYHAMRVHVKHVQILFVPDNCAAPHYDRMHPS